MASWALWICNDVATASRLAEIARDARRRKAAATFVELFKMRKK